MSSYGDHPSALPPNQFRGPWDEHTSDHIHPGPTPVRARDRRHILASVGLSLAVAGILAKVVYWLAFVHVALAAAHAGLATDAMVYGFAVVFLGFAMRWTDRFYGLSQVLWPDLYEDVGYWLIRIGYPVMAVGTFAVLITRYL